MLILTRRLNQAIRLGEDIRIVLVQVKGNQVRIGIECPTHVRIFREELYDIIGQQNLKTSSIEANQTSSPPNRQIFSPNRTLPT